MHRLVVRSERTGRLLLFHEWRCACGSGIEVDGVIVCRAQAARVGLYDTTSLGTVNSVWEWIDQEQAEFREQLQHIRKQAQAQQDEHRERERLRKQVQLQFELDRQAEQSKQRTLQRQAKYSKGQRRQHQRKEQARQQRLRQERQAQRRQRKRRERSESRSNSQDSNVSAA